MLDSLVKAKYPEVDIISTSTGSDDQGGWGSIFGAGGTHVIQYTYSLVPIEERSRSSMEVAEEIRKDFAKFPEIVDFTVSTTQNMGSFGSSAVDVEVYGYDISATNYVAQQLSDKIKMIPGTKDVTISRDKSKPELQIVFDQEK